MNIFLLIISFVTSFVCFASSSIEYKLPVNEQGYTLIHKAAINNDVETIKVLGGLFPNELKRPSEFNTLKKHTFKDTPAHLACFHASWKALETLLSLGARLDTKNNQQQTPENNICKKYLPFYRQIAQKYTEVDAQKAQIQKKVISSKLYTSQSTQTIDHPSYISQSTQTQEQNKNSKYPDISQKEPSILPPPYPNPPPYQDLQKNNYPLNPQAKPFCPSNSLENAEMQETSTPDWDENNLKLLLKDVLDI